MPTVLHRTVYRISLEHKLYFQGSLFYRGEDGTYLISRGEKIGEADIMSGARRIGTLQTQSEEVQLASIHKGTLFV